MPSFQALKFPQKFFLPLASPFTQEPIGFVVRKGDPDALNYFNNWIRVKQAEGFLEETKHHWFETRDWADRLK